MSEMPPGGFATDSSDAADAAAAAFDRLGRRIAGLVATTEGFAARQQEIQGRDYTQDLAHIHAKQEQIRGIVAELENRPMLRYTASTIGDQIAQAGRNNRAADHHALEAARGEFLAAIKKLDAWRAWNVEVRQQRYGLAAMAGVLLLTGMMLGNLAGREIDQAAPTSWHWPEQRAVGALGTNAWDAGSTLMQLDSAGGWQALMRASRLSRDNAAAITDCRAKAATTGEGVRCSIVVGEPAG